MQRADAGSPASKFRSEGRSGREQGRGVLTRAHGGLNGGRESTSSIICIAKLSQSFFVNDDRQTLTDMILVPCKLSNNMFAQESRRYGIYISAKHLDVVASQHRNTAAGHFPSPSIALYRYRSAETSSPPRDTVVN